MLRVFTETEVRHISTPGLVDQLTYRKCITCFYYRDESFHQVWSWYDHPSPSYSVIAADTLRDLVTLTFDLLTSLNGHTWRVTWSTPRPNLKFLRLYVLELWVLTSRIGYHWQCVCSDCGCAVSRHLCVGGNFFPHIWNPWPRFAYSLYNFYVATIKTNGVIRQDNVWPCAKDHTALCACAKSRQHWTLP